MRNACCSYVLLRKNYNEKNKQINETRKNEITFFEVFLL